MELDEVLQRVVRRYGLYLCLAVLIPVVLGLVIAHRQAPSYVATARVQLTPSTPDTAAAADAIVSQAQAAVTNTGAVSQALASAGADRDVQKLIQNDLSVTGVGSSSTVDIAVTDRDPVVAQKLAAALANHLVDSTNESRLGGLPGVLSSIDQQLTSLASRRAPLASAAQARPLDPVAQNRLAGMDRLISDLSADRDRLALEAAASPHATVLNQATVPEAPQPSRTPQILVLVAVCALVIALLVVALIEALRPHVSGGSRISRLLNTHPLGTVLASRRGLRLEVELTRRVRLAAQRAGGSTVVVAPVGRLRYVPHLVAALETQLVPLRPGLEPTVPAGTLAHPATLSADGDLFAASGAALGLEPGTAAAGGTALATEPAPAAEPLVLDQEPQPAQAGLAPAGAAADVQVQAGDAGQGQSRDQSQDPSEEQSQGAEAEDADQDAKIILIDLVDALVTAPRADGLADAPDAGGSLRPLDQAGLSRLSPGPAVTLTAYAGNGKGPHATTSSGSAAGSGAGSSAGTGDAAGTGDSKGTSVAARTGGAAGAAGDGPAEALPESVAEGRLAAETAAAELGSGLGNDLGSDLGNGPDSVPSQTLPAGTAALPAPVPAGVAQAPVPVPSGVLSVRSLDELGPLEDPFGVAVVVATPPAAPRAELDRVQDLLQISGWPLLGVITVAPNRRFWRRR